MTKFNGNISKIKKTANQYSETVIDVEGSAFISVDVSSCNKDMSVAVAIADKASGESYVILGEVIVPSGSFLSLFVRKMISNKSIIIRTTEESVIWYEMEKL